jgi:acyl-coenzyme A synthetase/AMP-(fatty) acid ligase/predicted RNA-binding protein
MGEKSIMIINSRLSKNHVFIEKTGEKVTTKDFIKNTQSVRAYISSLDVERVVLAITKPSDFMTAFIALCISDMEIILLPNMQEGTQKEYQGEYDFLLCDRKLSEICELDKSNLEITELELLDETKLSLFTSGSQGKPQKVSKTVKQLLCECEILEDLFGKELGSFPLLASVSQQHIYGLLFRGLWPLLWGREIANYNIDYPEDLLIAARSLEKFNFVASPAFLKRITGDSGLDKLNILNFIFSSGGPLSADASTAINRQFGIYPHEVYGSTETGGIATRTQAESNVTWDAFPGIELASNNLGCLRIKSPFMLEDEFQTNDLIELSGNYRFVLKGRVDRIYKIEENRVSLVEMENTLIKHEFIAEAHCLVIELENRSIIGAMVVLEQENDWNNQVKLAKVKAIKTYLRQFFEPILLPKKFRFVDELPFNQQSKLVRKEVLRHFDES